MKTSITLFAALFLMAGSAFANEGEEKGTKIKVVQWKAQVHQLFYEGTDEKVQIRVLNERGSSLLRKRINNKKGFALPLNFELQDAGTYKIQVTDSNGTHTEEITIDKD